MDMVGNNSSKSMSLDEFIEHLKKGEIPKQALRKEKHKGKTKFYVIPIEKELEEIANYHQNIFEDSIGQETFVYDKKEVERKIYRLHLIKNVIYSLKQGRISGVRFDKLWSNAKTKLAPNEVKTNILFLKYKNINNNLRKHYISWKRQQNAKFNSFYKK